MKNAAVLDKIMPQKGSLTCPVVEFDFVNLGKSEAVFLVMCDPSMNEL
jgi:hypothetical protein